MCGCGFSCGKFSGSVDGHGALVGVPKQQVDKTVSKVEEQDDYDEYQEEGYSTNSSIGTFGGGYYSQVPTSPASSLTGGSTSLKSKRTPQKSGTGSAGTLILYLVLFGAVCLVHGAQDLSAENELKNGSTSSAAQNGGFLIPTGPWLIVVIVLATVGILALLGLCILGAWYLWRRVPAGAVRSSSTSSSDEDSPGAGSSPSAPRNEIRKEKKVVRANRRGTKSPAKNRKNLDKRTSSPKKQIQFPKQSPLQIVSREEKKRSHPRLLLPRLSSNKSPLNTTTRRRQCGRSKRRRRKLPSWPTRHAVATGELLPISRNSPLPHSQLRARLFQVRPETWNHHRINQPPKKSHGPAWLPRRSIRAVSMQQRSETGATSSKLVRILLDHLSL